MDALCPRLLVDDFGRMFRFYRGVLGEIVGATAVKGDESGPYANWDLGDEAVLVLFDRAAMAAAVGAPPPEPRTRDQDGLALVLRVGDVDKAVAVCERYGAVVVAPARDRPQWAPNLRTAHLRDPDGNLLELQSY
ncbi:VOC family protein [Wenjunlia tyrosinilytica]|uniref:Extradiol dioxygenase n=1 Tax=Wenjunlia tyrosinilytica TaxID=1544741 RepID=A0A917ZKT9_9ACTN|nr:VOC family protein [Wenjunlia tyrosinilytica]GGO85264.1 extradiol dioxygenase [Wenjunlia tyrosinilytica]